MKLDGKQKNIIVVEVIFLIVGIILLVGVGGKKPDPTSTITIEKINTTITETENILGKTKTEYSSKYSKIFIAKKQEELNSLKSELNPDLEDIKLIEINGKIENIEFEINNYKTKLKVAEDNEKKFKSLEDDLAAFKTENKKYIKKFSSTKKSIKKIETKITEIKTNLEKIVSLDDYSVYDEISRKNYTIELLMAEMKEDFKQRKTSLTKKTTIKKPTPPPKVKDTYVEENYDTDPVSYTPPPPKVTKKLKTTTKPEYLHKPTTAEINYPKKFYGGNPCMIEVVIDTSGSVSSTKVYVPSGNSDFDNFCSGIAKKLYKFKPAEKIYDDGSREKIESTSILPFKPPSK
ncbi:hypothetical protein KAU33_12445 [Candidatus Dependentiae bacterium]|nr:hypothetical protein [Candidatus Dependentiae bacterium]